MPPTVSLSIIVKNVEKIVENCLRSAIPFVHEVVVVDTGSQDRTKDVIRRLAPGAVILDFLPETHPGAFLLDAEGTWNSKMPGPFTGKYMLANFAAARNFGLDRCTSNYVLWIDSDDVLERGENIPKILEEMERNNIDSAMVNYDYASDENNNVTCRLTRERIVRRDPRRIRWTQPIHEVLFPLGTGQYYETINIKHRRHEYGIVPEQQHRNLKVLTKWWNEHKDDKDLDARMIFYLAMEERFLWPDTALIHFKKYCQLSGWDEERSMAHMLAGVIYENTGKNEDAFSEYAQAALESNFNPDFLFGAARISYYRKDWAKCIEYTERGFEISKREQGRKSVLMYNPLDRVYRPYVYYSVALVETCQMKKAIEACDAGLQWNPMDPHLKGNKELAEKWLANKQTEAPSPAGNLALKFRRNEPLDAPAMDIPADLFLAFAIQMWKRNTELNNHVRALQLLDSLPDLIINEKIIREARQITTAKLDPDAISAESLVSKLSGPPGPPVSGPPAPGLPAPGSPAPDLSGSTSIISERPKLNITIWTGPAWERWSPLSLDTTGIGGSETAAICIARELQGRGHQVTVLADCDDGNYDGVRYVHFQKGADHPENYAGDVLVCSRQPWLYKNPPPSKASFLWVHDVSVGPPTAELGELLLKPDKVFCLSNWHKDYFLSVYPFMHHSSVIVTRNGIDTKYFAKEPKKEGNKIIYSSSPDRGLERLLELMPAIRVEIPDVELSIYYGFENWKKMTEAQGDQAEQRRVKHFESMLEEQTKMGTVKYYGRVSKQELADAFLRSKVWSYPTWFTETFGITAIEALAGGCVPVTTYLAALPETVSHGFMIRPPNNTQEYAEAFVSRVVTLLRDENERSKYASAGREYTLMNAGWDKVAGEWEKHFQTVLKTKAEEPLSLPTFGDY